MAFIDHNNTLEHDINDDTAMMHVDTYPVDDKERTGNERADDLDSCSDDDTDQGAKDHEKGSVNCEDNEEASQFEQIVNDILNNDEEPEAIEDNNEDCEQDQDEHQDNEQGDGNFEHSDIPLYTGATITVKITMILLLAFAVRHKLSNEAISDLLYIIDLICPKPNFCCRSVYKFKGYFSFMVNTINLCYYCPACSALVSPAISTICSVCNETYKSLKDLSYFIHISISNQIQALFSRIKFVTALRHRFQRQKQHEGNYEDIYDGSLYKNLMKPGSILRDGNNLSLMWNVDGVPLFKSSKYSLWPMYLLINELPYKQRVLKENSILAGLWFGEEKPNMSFYLKPIVEELITLESHGIEIRSPHISKPFICKAVLLAGSCDLPAKCLVLNSIQYNGYYGCAKCLQPGKTADTRHAHVYPFNRTNPVGPKRTANEHSVDAKEAHEGNKIVNGVKGPTWLMKLQYYDIIAGTAVDYMHCALLGVMKYLLGLWFNSEHNKENFYIGRSVLLVDKRLKEITPPLVISRKPRAISEHFKYYKASELRSFLLYYSLPILFGILPLEYWDHFSLLSTSIYILLQSSISEEQLQYCQKNLNTFCGKFQALYGERYMSANIHLLLHLPDTVRELGPLWVYSCFHFEGLNGMLKGLVRGTQHIDKQLMTSYSYMKHLPTLAEEFEHESCYYQAFKHIHYQINCFAKHRMEVYSNVFLLGKPTCEISEVDVVALSAVGFTDFRNVRRYTRMQIRDIKFYGSDWNSKHSNATVAYYQGNEIHYGIIKSFFHESTTQPTVLCTVTRLLPCDTTPVFKKAPHILACTQHDQLSVISINNIVCPCIYLSFSDVENFIYVVMLVNMLEKD